MDPYYLIYQDLNQTLDEARIGIKNRDEMLNDPRQVGVQVFITTGMQVTHYLNTVKESLKSINESIQAVRDNRELFSQITDQELENRQQFVTHTCREIQDLENRLSAQTAQQQLRSTPSQLYPSGNRDNSNGQSLLTEDNRSLILDQIAETAQIELQYSTLIKEELNDQDIILNDIGDRMDTAEVSMKRVTQNIKDLIEQEGKLPTFLVFILSIALVVLLFFVA